MALKKIIFLLLSLSLFTACKNRVQKSYEFINEYNDAAPLLKSNLIYRTTAKIIGEKILEEVIIEIDYDLNLKKADCETNVGVKMLPKTISYALIQDEAGDLINEGAVINLTFRSLDNYILNKITLDKKKMNQLLSENQTHVSDDYDFSSGKNPELVKILANLNRSLPIENETDKTKLLKLKLDRYNNIICITEAPEDFAQALKNPGTISYLKETVQRSNNGKIFENLKESYGVSKIIYRYQNSKGELLGDISFD
ncbi:hypothetical protein NAT51_07735 [Flavobacterium amniphilum]|uniref:hypothetical protein n=1 Tax=Flavobacterium amniphilum TaxID=1834035 RepID=UPI002029BDB7|nr:hypothetical protein [Flavobacterium amniphilum]MCL9805408.1 hypothetical protein [Flavobacterium amniphilum]